MTTVTKKGFNAGGTRKACYMKIIGSRVWVWGWCGVWATSGSQSGRKVLGDDGDLHTDLLEEGIEEWDLGYDLEISISLDLPH